MRCGRDERRRCGDAERGGGRLSDDGRRVVRAVRLRGGKSWRSWGYRRLGPVGVVGLVGARELVFTTLGGGAAPPSRAERACARQASELPTLGVGLRGGYRGLDDFLPHGARDVVSVFAEVADVDELPLLVEVRFSAEIAEAAVPADAGLAFFGELGVVLVEDERVVELGQRWGDCPPLSFDFFLAS